MGFSMYAIQFEQSHAAGFIAAMADRAATYKPDPEPRMRKDWLDRKDIEELSGMRPIDLGVWPFMPMMASEAERHKRPLTCNNEPCLCWPGCRCTESGVLLDGMCPIPF